MLRESRSSAVCSAATVAYSERRRRCRRRSRRLRRAAPCRARHRPGDSARAASALARHGVVGADAEAGDVVVELDLEPIAGRPSPCRAGPRARSAPASRRGPGSARPGSAQRPGDRPEPPPHKAGERQPQARAGTAREAKRASCDDVHQAIGNDDHLARRLAARAARTLSSRAPVPRALRGAPLARSRCRAACR
jgi:hypothetical protein